MTEQVSSIQSTANSAVDWIENPRQILDYSYPQQQEIVARARREVIDAATSRKRVELMMYEVTNELAELDGEAGQAMGAQQEKLAREEVLTRKLALQDYLSNLQTQLESLQDEEQTLYNAFKHLQLFRMARLKAMDELTAAGIDDVAGAEDFVVDPGGLLDRTWVMLRSLFVPSVPVAAVLTAATAGDATEAVLQLYKWERNRLMTLAKGAAGAAVTVLVGLIATGIGGKAGVNSATLFVAAPLVVILLIWGGFLLVGLRSLTEQYPVALELVRR